MLLNRGCRSFVLGVIGAALLVTVSGCSAPAPIKVGSKSLPESIILGEMYALLFEDTGLEVERKLELEGADLTEPLKSGEIDIYPEYTGTGLQEVLKLPPSMDEKEVYDTVAREYKKRFNLVWLDAAPMNNTYALAVTEEVAMQYSLATISDMAAKAGEFTLVGTEEWKGRPDGLPGLEQAYGGFQLKDYAVVGENERYQGLIEQHLGNMVLAFGTDGEIDHHHLVVLEDDKGFFPPYQVAPVVRAPVLQASPEIAERLDALAPRLTDATMRQLNYQVSGDGKPAAQVARTFLVEQKLLK